MNSSPSSCPAKNRPTAAINIDHGTEPAASTRSIAAPEYGKAKAVAPIVGVSTKTLFRWAEAGHISRFKLNARTVLFSPAEVAAYVRSCRVV
jgi:hypothetical protein